MSGSATLVMLVSMTSRIAPSEAARAMTHLREPRASSRAAIGESSDASDP